MGINRVVGIVSLGVMGSSLASSLLSSGHSVIWASHGRSQKTIDRARSVGAIDVGTIKELSDRSDVIMSVGFGNSGPETAERLIHVGFDKILVDFNSLWGESSEHSFMRRWRKASMTTLTEQSMDTRSTVLLIKMD